MLGRSWRRKLQQDYFRQILKVTILLKHKPFMDKIYNPKLNNVARGVDTYWLSKPLRTVFNQKHSLYLDGGTENLRWGADFLL